MSGNKHDNGVLELGTDEIRVSYQEDTPGQSVEDYIEEKEKAFHEQKNKVKKHFSQVFGNQPFDIALPRRCLQTELRVRALLTAGVRGDALHDRCTAMLVLVPFDKLFRLASACARAIGLQRHSSPAHAHFLSRYLWYGTIR
mgnify:CR=1 FL=1